MLFQYAISLLLEYVVFVELKHSGIVPSLSHPTSNRLMWSSQVGRQLNSILVDIGCIVKLWI